MAARYSRSPNTTNTGDKVIALAGNPNVGKSTVFNSLTGLNQHTGNWLGKTVTNAKGRYRHRDNTYIMVDIPGTYSLMANSTEEEIARDFICFGNPDATIIVTDATCLERNLNLVLQTLEITSGVVICINLIDEAKKKKININLKELSKQLGVPVVGATARSGEGLNELMDAVYEITNNTQLTSPSISLIGFFCAFNRSYCSGSSDDFINIKNSFKNNISHGWTWLTAVCVMLFSLMHWPCGTTCLTIRKETHSWKWTFVSFLIPTLAGIVICFIVATTVRLLGLA